MIMEKGKEIYSKREREGDGPTRKGQDEERPSVIFWAVCIPQSHTSGYLQRSAIENRGIGAISSRKAERK